MRAEIRPATADDIAAIVANARPADVAEMTALGTSVEESLRGGLQCSDWTYTGLLDGVPVCMFGVAPFSILNGEGRPWMLAANGLEAAQVPFLRACRPVVRAMRESYPRLVNIIDDRNVVAKRWLRWLGFSFDERTMPINGVPFRVFKAGEWNV